MMIVMPTVTQRQKRDKPVIGSLSNVMITTVAKVMSNAVGSHDAIQKYECAQKATN
jgi:hypothetical protein